VLGTVEPPTTFPFTIVTGPIDDAPWVQREFASSARTEATAKPAAAATTSTQRATRSLRPTPLKRRRPAPRSG
jgi:hypothetical protein